MKHEPGNVWMNLGLLLLASALFLAACNRNASYQAQRQSQVVMEEMRETIPDQAAPKRTQPEQTELFHPHREMPVRTIDGRDYIGVLTIPSLDLELPVLSRWSDSNLRIAPCRYQGSVYDGSLILCAHNYSSHFGALKDLREGDVVLFTDMQDNVYTFKVEGMELLDSADVAGMESGDWDMTLFTCTVGGQNRVTIRLVLTPTI